MPHLIEVESDLLAALEALYEAEESGEPASEAALELFRERALYAAEKRDHVAQAFAFLDERILTAKANEVAQARRRKMLENAREKLSEFVLSVLVNRGIIAACGDVSKLVVTESESVDVVNVDALPDELCRIKTVREPDKASIRAALEKGEHIDMAAGARIQRRSRLAIKPLAVKDRPGDTLLKGRVE